MEKFKAFVGLVGERAVKTFCQAEAALLIGAGTGLLDTDWTASLSVSGMAALLSVLTTVGGNAVAKPKGDDGAADTGLLLLVLTFVGVVLLLFGVKFG